MKMLRETKNNKQITEKHPKVVISNKVNNYGNDPFFIKKAKETKKFLEKNGFPKELLLKR